MKAVVRVFIAHVRANVWCLFHFGHCILTHQTKARGCWPQTDRIEAGTGSVINGTWKTARVFYANNTDESRTAPVCTHPSAGSVSAGQVDWDMDSDANQPRPEDIGQQPKKAPFTDANGAY